MAAEKEQRYVDALNRIRTSGGNTDTTAQWMQMVAAHAMEPDCIPKPPEQPPEKPSIERIPLLREARALGIHPMIATDVDVYVASTLHEIAGEWEVSPVKLLAALSLAFPLYDKTGINWQEFARKPGEPFSEFMQRNLAKHQPA
jgi:hypothetical protein